MKIEMTRIVSLLLAFFAITLTVSESSTQELIDDEERPSLFLSYLCLQSEHFKELCINDLESKNTDDPVQNLLRKLKAQRIQKASLLHKDLMKSSDMIKRRSDQDSGFYSNW